jgi:hypothetical protein
VIENVEERQAAMQRALDSEFSLSAEPENDIEID